MAIPVLLWGAAAVLGATGLVKGAGAISDINEAKEKGERAERRYIVKQNKKHPITFPTSKSVPTQFSVTPV